MAAQNSAVAASYCRFGATQLLFSLASRTHFSM
jgi:hypothetical protein